MDNPQRALTALTPTQPFFIGIDSDGCAFDTMELKHKECFCPNFIHYFGLQAVSSLAREVWEFVNLYSTTRGYNRFKALQRALMLLDERPEAKARGFEKPDMQDLDAWLAHETKLGNPALETYLQNHDSRFLKQTLDWSLAVNRTVESMVSGVAPFPYMRESLDRVTAQADTIVVSQTPLEALEREWKEHHLDDNLLLIAGQEHGTKSEHLKLGAKDKYANDHILMIGDAPGDLQAATENGVLFFPINPGDETTSWQRFYEEGIDRFFNGSFAGDYENGLIEQFKAYLPETPPWKSA